MENESTAPETPKAPEQKSNKTLWIVIGVLAVLLVGGIMYVVGVNNSTTEAIRTIFIKAPTPTVPETVVTPEPTPTDTPTDIEPTEEVTPTEEPEPTEEVEPTTEVTPTAAL